MAQKVCGERKKNYPFGLQTFAVASREPEMIVPSGVTQIARTSKECPDNAQLSLYSAMSAKRENNSYYTDSAATKERYTVRTDHLSVEGITQIINSEIHLPSTMLTHRCRHPLTFCPAAVGCTSTAHSCALLFRTLTAHNQ